MNKTPHGHFKQNNKNSKLKFYGKETEIGKEFSFQWMDKKWLFIFVRDRLIEWNFHTWSLFEILLTVLRI